MCTQAGALVSRPDRVFSMQNDDQSEDWDAEYLRRLGLITVNFAGLESKVSSFIAQLMIKARAAAQMTSLR